MAVIRKRNLKLILAVAADPRKQYDIAFAADLMPEQLSKFKNGFTKPSAQQQQAIAAALGMNVADLFEDTQVAS